jgi:hypothetical protein
LIIDVDGDPLVFYPEEVSEDTGWVVVLARVLVKNLIHASCIFGNGSRTGKEPAVRETALFDSGWSKLAELTLKVHFLTRV